MIFSRALWKTLVGYASSAASGAKIAGEMQRIQRAQQRAIHESYMRQRWTGGKK